MSVTRGRAEVWVEINFGFWSVTRLKIHRYLLEMSATKGRARAEAGGGIWIDFPASHGSKYTDTF